jgi:hypothetical protein
MRTVLYFWDHPRLRHEKNLKGPNYYRKDLMHCFQNKKGEPNNKSEGAIKPRTGGRMLRRGTVKISSVLKNILRNRSFLQCCPNAIYRDGPIVKGQENINASGDQKKELDVSRYDLEKFHVWSTGGMHCTLYAPNIA